MIIFCAIVVMGIVLIGPMSANAATWATVSIDRVGTNATTNTNFVYLTHVATSPAFTNKQFGLEATMQNEMLATILTAISLEKNLNVRIMDDGITIDTLYIDNN